MTARKVMMTKINKVQSEQFVKQLIYYRLTIIKTIKFFIYIYTRYLLVIF
jgi:hypothetical protein